jgi:hypothetical protein
MATKWLPNSTTSFVATSFRLFAATQGEAQVEAAPPLASPERLRKRAAYVGIQVLLGWRLDHEDNIVFGF